MAGRNDRHIELTVTVSGQDVPVTVNANQKTEHIIREALRRSGNAGQSADAYELRRQDGSLVPLGITAAEAQLVDGMVLSLAPTRGEGG